MLFQSNVSYESLIEIAILKLRWRLGNSETMHHDDSRDALLTPLFPGL